MEQTVGQVQYAICDVCRLVDGDMSTKLCRYCGECRAWICLADFHRWDRRAYAAAIAQFHKLESGERANV